MDRIEKKLDDVSEQVKKVVDCSRKGRNNEFRL